MHYYIDQSEGQWIHIDRTADALTYDVIPQMWGKSIRQTIRDGLMMLTDANPGLRFVKLASRMLITRMRSGFVSDRKCLYRHGDRQRFLQRRSTRYEIH